MLKVNQAAFPIEPPASLTRRTPNQRLRSTCLKLNSKYLQCIDLLRSISSDKQFVASINRLHLPCQYEYTGWTVLMDISDINSPMNRLLSLQQIKLYKPVLLPPTVHATLAKTLRLFTASLDHSQLTYDHHFEQSQLPTILQKMSRIGWAADEMDHHPEWTLQEGSLAIRLSTHDIGNRLSVKDYVLASWIEEVLGSKGIEEALCESWNRNGLDLSELK